MVVVGAVPWQGVGPSRRRTGLVAGALFVGAVAAASGWLAWTRTRTDGRTAQPLPARAAGSLPVGGEERTLAPEANATPAVAPAVGSALASPPPPRALEIPLAAGSAASGPTAAVEVDLRLNAISERDGKPVALIGGRLVHEGDRFGEVRVLRIGPAEVEIELRGKPRTLRF